MAYTPVPTVSTGDTWTAAQQNAYLKDNMTAVFPYTTKGDLAVASAANNLARLGVVSDYQLLQSRTGATNGVEWSGPVGCILYNASVNASASTTTTASFTTETLDNAGFHDNLTNPSRITIPAGYGGIYEVCASGYWDFDAGGAAKLEWVLKDGGAVPIMGNVSTPVASASIYGFKSCKSYQVLAAGNYLELQIRQVTAGGLSFKEVQFSCLLVR